MAGPRHARPVPNIASRHRLKLRRHRALKITVMSLVSILLFGGTAVATRLYDLQSNIRTVDISHLLVESARPSHRATTKGDKSPGDPFAGQAVNILLFGVDDRSGDNARIVKDEQDGAVLNDVNMIVHISADRQRIDTVALPRDLLVDLPGCIQVSGDEGHPIGYHGQINAAWAQGTGGGEGNHAQGIACVVKTVEEVTGVRLDGWVMVDFFGFVSMVDALGGVEMCIEEDFKGQGLNVEITAGMQTLDGRTALRYARTRKGWSGEKRLDGSDLERIGRQQQMISAVIHKVLAERSLGSIPKVNNFATALTKSLTVSDDLNSIRELIGLAYSLRNIEMANVSLLQMPTVPAWSDSNRVEPDDYGSSNPMGMTAQEVFEYLATDQPIPGTVPYKLINPDPPAEDQEGDPASPAPHGTAPKPTPEQGIVTAFDAPVTCKTG
ncbi:MAG: LCP family protein [Micrococcales bacterium]|nr:LCP family protein [Micrococcales bacterium]